VPRESERLDRRRQYLQNKMVDEPSKCCDAEEEGEERLASLPVIAEQ